MRKMIAAATALLVIVALSVPVVADADPAAYEGDLPERGLGIVRSTGSSTDDLLVAAAGAGCEVGVIWGVHRGSFAIFVNGAQANQNAGWYQTFPDEIPTGTRLYVFCTAASPTATPTVSPTPSPTVTPTPSPTVTPTPSPTVTPTPSPTVPPAPATNGELPAGWPSTFELGVSDAPGGAAARAGEGFAFRNQYLSGGVNTGSGWANWNADGSFVTYYIEDSRAAGITPVFTYYMMAQSSPGASAGEASGVTANVNNASTMGAYFEDLRLFFQRAGASDTPVTLHVEPDLWGFLQQQAGSNDASNVRVRVSSSGVPDLAGLPDDLAGFAEAIVLLRDRYAPNVTLGYHVSTWGTGVDIALSDPSDAEVDRLAGKAASFYRSLGADFDVLFAEFSDRDAGFKEAIYGDGGASWWDDDDFRRFARFLSGVVDITGKRVVLWQIPMGNTQMRAMNNTWNHYQDNRVEWLIGEGAEEHRDLYQDAGVIALIFGRGADGATCGCDAAQDGRTDPPAINGNTRLSLSADDDGGYFKDRVEQYYTAGAEPLD